MQYEDFGNIDYSNRRDDYLLPLTTTLDDTVEGRYGERIVGLRGLESGINAYVSGGSKKFAYNVASGYKINPMLGAVTSKPEQWAVGALGKIPGVKPAVGAMGKAFNAINPTGFSLKYLDSTAAARYDNAWAGLNLVKDGQAWKGFGKGAELVKKGLSSANASKAGQAMRSAFSITAGDTMGTKASKIGLRTAVGYGSGRMVGGLIGSAFGNEEVGADLGGVTGSFAGLTSDILPSAVRFAKKEVGMLSPYGSMAKATAKSYGRKLATTGIGQKVSAAANAMDLGARYAVGKSYATMGKSVTKSAVSSAIGSVSGKGIAKVVGAGLGMVNALSLIDMPFMIADIASDIRMQGQINYITGFEGRQQEIRNNPTNTQMINRNVGMSNNNQNEMNYLLTRPNLARDMSYRYSDANYGF